MRRWLMHALAGSSLCMASGCERPSHPAELQASAPAASAVHTPAPRATLQQWRNAVDNSIPRSAPKTDSDGLQEWFACLRVRTPEGACKGGSLVATRDPFRSGVKFVGGESSFFSHGATVAVVPEAVAPDCLDPMILLRARTRTNRGLVLERLDVLADGEVILSITAPPAKTSLTLEGRSVSESLSGFLSPQETAAMAKLATASEVSVRVTGSRAWVQLSGDSLRSFRQDMGLVLEAAATIAAATKRLGQPCQPP
jgi:hypothetical protein